MKYSILASLLLLLSCTNSPKELMSNLLTDFPKSEELTKVSESQISELYAPNEFILKDSLLFVFEQGDNFFIRCININTKKELARINKGNANNEMTNVGTMALYGNDSLTAIDFGNTVKTFSIKDMISGQPFTASVIMPTKNVPSFSFVRTNDDEYFCSGQNDSLNNYFIIKGDKLEAFGKENNELSILDKSIDISPMLLWARELKSNKEQEKAISATRLGLLFEVIDLKKKCVDAHKYYEKINFKMGSQGIEVAPITMRNIFCSKDNIFIILAEQTSPTGESYRTAKFNYSMLTFDWELNPLKKYNLNTPSQSRFYVSSDGENLMVLSTEDEEKGYLLTKYLL